MWTGVKVKIKLFFILFFFLVKSEKLREVWLNYYITKAFSVFDLSIKQLSSVALIF